MTDCNSILRFDEVMSMTGKGRSSIWHEIKKGVFVPPINMGPRSAGFIQSEIQALIAARALNMPEAEIKDLITTLVNKRRESASRLIAELTA